MPRTIATIATALAAVVIAAPVALARPIDDPARYRVDAATTTATKQDLRSPDARDAARPKTPADVTAALAQERYYSSYGDPEPLSLPQPTAPYDETPWLPIAAFIAIALAIVAATATQLRRVRIRRRAARVAT